jgi:hypothetical protein
MSLLDSGTLLQRAVAPRSWANSIACSRQNLPPHYPRFPCPLSRCPTTRAHRNPQIDCPLAPDWMSACGWTDLDMRIRDRPNQAPSVARMKTQENGVCDKPGYREPGVGCPGNQSYWYCRYGNLNGRAKKKKKKKNKKEREMKRKENKKVK